MAPPPDSRLSASLLLTWFAATADQPLPSTRLLAATQGPQTSLLVPPPQRSWLHLLPCSPFLLRLLRRAAAADMAGPAACHNPPRQQLHARLADGAERRCWAAAVAGQAVDEHVVLFQRRRQAAATEEDTQPARINPVLLQVSAAVQWGPCNLATRQDRSSWACPACKGIIMARAKGGGQQCCAPELEALPPQRCGLVRWVCPVQACNGGHTWQAGGGGQDTSLPLTKSDIPPSESTEG